MANETSQGHASSPADTEAGFAAFDSHRFGDALAIWRRGAESGDARAAFGLGLLNDLGAGMPQDEQQALRWYSKAAEGQIIAAEFNVAVMFDSGTGAARDTAIAAFWYAKAAAHDNARAQYNLAQLYQAGDGVPHNLAMAEIWFKAAAGHGLADASEKLRNVQKTLFAQRPGAPADLLPAAPYALPSMPAATSGNLNLELGWSAPSEDYPVSYAVQIVALDGAAPDIVFLTQSSRSAVVASLPAQPGHYAWRVYTVAPGISDYAASEWSYFAIN